MRNGYIFKLLTGEEAQKFSGIDHAVVCYVDDVQHVIGHRSNKVLEEYVNLLHKLNKGLYSANFLQMNATKTKFIHICKTSEKGRKLK